MNWKRGVGGCLMVWLVPAILVYGLGVLGAVFWGIDEEKLPPYLATIVISLLFFWLGLTLFRAGRR